MLLEEPKKNWGGSWTEKKLDAFAKYVRAYLTIMRKYPYWKTIYFDGFAGSGSRTREAEEVISQLSLPISPEETKVYEGSAERILKLGEGFSFDYYYFIDKESDSLDSLQAHLESLPEATDKTLVFRPGDANQHLEDLSEALKRRNPSYAALVFLDPFGMQIKWKSIANLKGTRSDVWILVPTGVIVNRLLDKNGELKSIKKLESFFGLEEQEIRAHFYQASTVQTLFGEIEHTQKVMKPIEKIATLYIERLQTVWDHVTPNPLPLTNSRGVPIFHFVFASNNSNAVKIASQIIQKP